MSDLRVSRNDCYKWLDQSLVPPAEIDFSYQIQEIAMEFSRYGYRRVTAELRIHEYLVNNKCMMVIMRENNLLCSKKKFKPVTADSSHGLSIYPAY
jgi:putative transposase